MTPKVDVQILHGVSYFNHRTHRWTPVNRYFSSHEEAEEYAQCIVDPHSTFMVVTPPIF